MQTWRLVNITGTPTFYSIHFYRFVLYQLSKNLNRPFFMDFLTHLSVRFAHGHVCDEEADTEDDDAPLIGQMNKMLKPSSKVSY